LINKNELIKILFDEKWKLLILACKDDKWKLRFSFWDLQLLK
jgi:hypothetical protein